MPDEQPPLGKFVIQSFQEDDLGYPVVVVARDPTIAGYTVPALAAACPDPRYAATHTFTGVTITSLGTRALWKYERLPGPILTGHQRTQTVRGRTVDVTTQEDASGNIPVETGSLILESTVDPLSSGKDRRTTKKVASVPGDEKSAFWDSVPIPLLLFGITNTIYCNDTQFGTLVTNPVKAGGSSQIRKHRKTVSYSTTLPNPDLSAASFATAAVEYGGKFIKFNYGNVLNDAISYSADLGISSGSGSCIWTEAYSFSATTPSATTFAAGAWYVRDFQVEPWGDSMWKSTKTEFYSAAGNPTI